MQEHVPTLRLCGIAGIVGACLLLAADWILMGTFTSGSEFKENWYVVLSQMPQWRLTVGGLAGPVGAWLYVVGFWQLYLTLNSAGRYVAFGVFAGFSMSFVWLAGAFHTSFPFMAHAWKAKEAATGEGAAVVQEMKEATFSYAGRLYYLGLAPAFIGTVLLAYAVLRGLSRYPRWFAALNPAILFLLSTLFQYLPAPLGGLLVIGAGNLVFLLFFTVSTVLIWNGGKCEGTVVEPPKQAPDLTGPAR